MFSLFCTRLLDTGLDCVALVALHAHALMLYDIDLCYRLYVLYSMFTLCVDVTFNVKGDAIQDHNIISIHDTSRPLDAVFICTILSTGYTCSYSLMSVTS